MSKGEAGIRKLACHPRVPELAALPCRLLDSYASSPKIRSNESPGKLLVANPVGTTLRRTLAPLALGRPANQRSLIRAISQLDVSYHDDSGSQSGSSVRVGDRAPLWAARNNSTDFTLVNFEPSPSSVAADGPDPYEPGAGPALGELLDELPPGTTIEHHLIADAEAQIYGVQAPTLLLIRPDGYVAARGGSLDTAAYLRKYRNASVASIKEV